MTLHRVLCFFGVHGWRNTDVIGISLSGPRRDECAVCGRMRERSQHGWIFYRGLFWGYRTGWWPR